jgi:hypothetical protein
MTRDSGDWDDSEDEQEAVPQKRRRLLKKSQSSTQDDDEDDVFDDEIEERSRGGKTSSLLTVQTLIFPLSPQRVQWRRMSGRLVFESLVCFTHPTKADVAPLRARAALP